MKLIPILFSTPMVEAILLGRKTLTRRVVKPRSYITDVVDGVPYEMTEDDSQPIKCPYGQPGDVLWVRESWCLRTPYGPEEYYFGYKIDTGLKIKASSRFDFESPDIWKPSIHMPKEACRLFLRITNIRVERLKDITDQDAIAEGIEGYFEKLFMEWRYRDYDKKLQKGYGKSNIDYPTWREPVSSFKSLWESINGKESWEANPWVWVVKFEKMEGRPDGF